MSQPPPSFSLSRPAAAAAVQNDELVSRANKFNLQIDNSEVKNYLQKTQYSANNLGAEAKQYIYNLFPFARWIKRYNKTWLLGDIVRGLRQGS